jgi:adenylosuccinate synthase
MNNVRLNSVSVVGGAFGDEGKGKIVDEICSTFINRFDKVIVYRWNGGSNAGHTVEFQNKKVILHQIPSGAMIEGSTCILGKGMVIHPNDLIFELKQIEEIKKIKSEIIIDEMATLALDTHRAFEFVLKKHEEGGTGSTGRSIAPAYADIIYRHPLKARDLLDKNWKVKFEQHYLLYKDLIKGLGGTIEDIEVNTLEGKMKLVGSKQIFIKNVFEQREQIIKYIRNVYDFVKENWISKTPFVFEGAQGVGLDLRWGVYPDVTASDPTLSGIQSSTEGLIDSDQIEIKTNIIKSTYTSSVGKRMLPTKMNEDLATKIREDANEYGATTKRPRDIYHIDIPALKFFSRVSKATDIILTHMDISYLEMPIKVCTKYVNNKGEEVDYRPDQKYLLSVTPVYEEFKSWDGNIIKNSTSFDMIPEQARNYIKYISKHLKLNPLMITTGPDRDSVIKTNSLLL